MTLFQILSIGIIVSVIGIIIAGATRGQFRKRVAVFWISVWACGGVTLVWPELTMKASKAVGIGRGADLLLYCTVIAGTWSAFWLYTRVRRLERQITLLVRRLAIEHAREPMPGVGHSTATIEG
ncbi:MAG: DUF2304 domain-containing protein [Myxococcales bacterium]|nr:DUF2304 domain-containing protein [Myxococcales bacterium]